jgi:ABC-type antimicrobial peptide transport system permease subunit
VVWTRAQIRSFLLGLLGQILIVLRLLALTCFVLAILVGAVTAAASLSVRRQAFGVIRLAGATRRKVGQQLGSESVVVAIVAWIIALPLGLLSTKVVLAAIGSQSGLFPPVSVPVAVVLATLPASLLATTLAVWVPGRRLVAGSVVDGVNDEAA